MKRLALIAAVIFLAACSPAQSTREFFAMDTLMQIKAYGSGADGAISRAIDEVSRLESLWSATFEGSEIFAANQNGGGQISQDTYEIISAALDISQKTGGAFDISVGAAVKLWGFTGNLQIIPTAEQLERAISTVGAGKITLTESAIALADGTQIDLGAVAKGFAGQRLSEMLRESGVKSAILSLGGNVQAVGEKPGGLPWVVGIRDPISGSGTIGTLEIRDAAVITSGITERYFIQNGIKYHHILDPKTCAPARSGLAGVTVIARDGTLADALSTALFVMGERAAIDFWRGGSYDFEMILVRENGEILLTEGIAPAFSASGGAAAQLIARQSNP